jgi:hypothetical protein
MALARVLELSEENGVVVENFASWLARMPASQDVELVEPTAWSCSHGVERWRSNCGCRMDQSVPPHQEWRTPLRVGLDRLAQQVHEIFESEGTPIFGDPWNVRDEYATVDIAEPHETYEFVRARLGEKASADVVRRGRELLEMEHDALRMFTSCAWFFDDIGGLEPAQVIRYASRAIVLSGARDALEAPLLETLATALSIDPKVGNGAEVYRRVALAVDAPTRVAAAATALASLGLEPQALLPRRAFTASVSGDVVSVVSQRTGGKWRYRVRILEPELERWSSEVALLPVGDEETEGAAGDARVVSIGDLPEDARHAIRAQLRHALIATCLTSDERARLAAGEASLRDLAGFALARELRALAASGTSADSDSVTHLKRLVDLIEQLETTVPFDAQTAFWRLWERSTAESRATLAGLKQRLGFA